MYDQLIEKAKLRGLDKKVLDGYFEKHHILPKSLGGGDEPYNLVLLTAREHFIAHLLLWKANPTNRPLIRAAYLMGNRRKGAGGKIAIQTKINSREYKELREAYSEIASEFSSGEANYFYGKPLSAEIKQKIYETKVKNGTCRKIEDRVKILKGRPIGKKHHMFGKRPSDESIAKMKASHKARDARPWENSSSTDPEVQLKWAKCDEYYNYWLKCNKCGLKKLTRLYNEEFNTSLNLSYFTNPRLKFLDGWIPSEDQKWLAFKEDYLRETNK